MSQFIDFKAVRNSLDAEAIVRHYGLNVARNSGEQINLHCPWHEDRKPSMSINPSKRVFNCFACGTGGNLLDLVARLEGFNPETPDGIRSGALAAVELFGGGGETTTKAVAAHTANIQEVGCGNERCPEDHDVAGEDRENSEFTIDLKLTVNHRELRERGFKKETYANLGIGYCKRGMMKQRIVFPLFEPNGMKVGYCGRWADGDLPKDQPRYLLPKNINKSRILWNWDRIRVHEPKHIVIVEGFWSVLRLEEADIPAVATMGHHLFDRQIDMLVNDGVEQVTVIFDGDDPGQAGADKACSALAKHLFVRSIVLQDDQKPDTMPKEFLADLPRFS